MVLGLIGGSVDASGVNLLARFVGGIGANPIAGVVGPANADGSFPSVKVNIVRNVMPAGGQSHRKLLGKRLKTTVVRRNASRAENCQLHRAGIIADAKRKK